MKKITVLGLGNWGTALAEHYARNGLTVTAWCREPDIAVGVNTNRVNPACFSTIRLSDGLTATNDLNHALGSTDLVVVALPASIWASFFKPEMFKRGLRFVSAAKGLVPGEHFTPLKLMASLGAAAEDLAVLSGPTFASDVMGNKPCGIVSASSSEPFASELAELTASKSLRVYTSTDPLGVELGGILKNVIAVAAGVVDGLQLGDSARAGIITRGLAEMMRLSAALGANPQTLCGLAGLGDLVMTATCDQSRNRTVGVRLGKGESLEHIIKTLGSVAEGVKTAPLVAELAKKYGVEMPITNHVNLLLMGQKQPDEMAGMLLGRPIKSEFGDINAKGVR
jgi:glycerol-3-phosphate dehydrogenase (NAD(P)+)